MSAAVDPSPFASLLAAAVGCAGMLTVHLGMGVQKLGVQRMTAGARGRAVYASGVALTVVGSLANVAALWLGLATPTLAVFSGVGLLALIAFANRRLEEVIARAETSALVMIVAGAVVGASAPVTPPGAQGSLTPLLVAAGAALAVAVAAELRGSASRPARLARALVQAAVSGVHGGLALIAQRELAAATEWGATLLPLSVAGLVSLGALVFLSLAFRSGRAVVLVPLSAASSMLTAGLFGWLCGREPLTQVHGVSMLLAVVGVAWIVRSGLRDPDASSVRVATHP